MGARTSQSTVPEAESPCHAARGTRERGACQRGGTEGRVTCNPQRPASCPEVPPSASSLGPGRPKPPRPPGVAAAPPRRRHGEPQEKEARARPSGRTWSAVASPRATAFLAPGSNLDGNDACHNKRRSSPFFRSETRSTAKSLPPSSPCSQTVSLPHAESLARARAAARISSGTSPPRPPAASAPRPRRCRPDALCNASSLTASNARGR